jgi:hypothetical protein
MIKNNEISFIRSINLDNQLHRDIDYAGCIIPNLSEQLHTQIHINLSILNFKEELDDLFFESKRYEYIKK